MKNINKSEDLCVYEIDFDMCKDRDIYLKYKSGVIMDWSFDEKVNCIILNLLVKNGFLLDDIGTYLYKDVIKNVIKCMDNPSLDVLSLKGELSNLYSQFYFDISRNERDMGVKSFHFYIKKSISNLGDDGNLSSLFSRVGYGPLAYDIASYIIETYKFNKCDNVGMFKLKTKTNDTRVSYV